MEREELVGEGDSGTRAVQAQLQAVATDKQAAESTKAKACEEPVKSRAIVNSTSARGIGVVTEKDGALAVKSPVQQDRCMSPAKRSFGNDDERSFGNDDENGRVNQRPLSAALLMKDAASYEDAKRAARERGRIKAMEKDAEKKKQAEKVCKHTSV
jgi:hypothetical protein